MAEDIAPIDQEEPMAGEKGFLFDWEVLLDATVMLNPVVGADQAGVEEKAVAEKREVEVLFTRVHIDDRELLNKGNDASEGDADEEKNFPKAFKSRRSMKNFEVLKSSPPSSPHVHEPVDSLAVGMDAMDIDTGGAHDEEGYAEQGSRKDHHRYMAEYSVEDYWADAGQYLLDVAARECELVLEFGDSKKKWKRGPKKGNRPWLLQCHKKRNAFASLKIALAEMKEGSNEEDYMAVLNEALRRKVEEDFPREKGYHREKNQEKFKDRLANLGYAHGFSGGEENMANLLVHDVYFESYPSTRGHIFLAILRPTGKQTKDEPSPHLEELQIDVPFIPSPQTSISSIDFSYDAERDSALLASSALDHFSCDDATFRKYWYQRYRLFSRFDDGVLMDKEGWFSVTPERLAEHIADRIVASLSADKQKGPMSILDAFTGVGGNAIQFALRGANVIAIDLDPVKIKCAKRNAEIYGVSHRITFICANFFHLAASLIGSRPLTIDGEGHFGIDAVFLSPPWGGPAYLAQATFDLIADMHPDCQSIMDSARQLSPNLCLFLPRNSSVRQLVELGERYGGGRMEVEQNLLNGKLKTLSVYMGDLAGE